MKVPEPFWAVIIIFLGVILAAICLFHSNAAAAVIVTVLGIASNLVSGGLGAFAGHASAKSDLSVPNGTIISSTGGDPTFPTTK